MEIYGLEGDGMLDFKFDWNDQLCVGITAIDEQHKMLFRLGRDLEQHILARGEGVTKKELLEYLCEVRNYVTYHFYTEEQIIKNFDEQFYLQQKALHDEGVRQLNAINVQALLEDVYEGLKVLKQFLQDWVLQHVIGADMQIRQFVKETTAS